MKQITIILFFIFTFSFSAFPQKQVRKELRNGNKEYKQEKYTEAEVAYRKALAANAHSKDVAYNLGNSLYKQEKLPEALEQYQAAASEEKDKEKAAATWHNAGNVFMKNKEYEKSIDAYKQALRKAPYDDETRYNLALAQKLLENQQQQQQQNQNKDKNKDKDKQDQNKDKNKDKQDQNKDKQDQNKDQQQKQDQQQNQDQQQQNPNQMQRQNAEQILDAMMQNERDTQEKVKAQQVQKQRKTDKNW